MDFRVLSNNEVTINVPFHPKILKSGALVSTQTESYKQLLIKMKSCHASLYLLSRGFYSNAELRAQLDVRFFLRISKDLMQKRRLGRKDYVLNDGSVWTDPPDYFEQVVWPSYVEGNSGLFKNADVIHGALQWPLSEQSVDGSPIRNLHLIDTEHLSVSEVCDIACDLLYKQIWLNNA